MYIYHVMSSWKCHAMYVYNIYIYVVISYLYPHTHTLLDTLSSVLNTEIYGSPAVSEHHIEKTMTEHPPSFPSLALHSCTIPPKKTLLGHPRNSCSATPEELAMAVQEWLGYPKWLFCNMPTFNGEHDDQPVNSFPNVQTLIKQSHQVMRPNMLSY